MELLWDSAFDRRSRMQHGASPEGSSKEMCPLLMASNIQGVLSITLIPYRTVCLMDRVDKLRTCFLLYLSLWTAVFISSVSASLFYYLKHVLSELNPRTLDIDSFTSTTPSDTNSPLQTEISF